MTWYFVDEHPDSINDAAFFSPYRNAWIDLPASYHGGAGGVAFVVLEISKSTNGKAPRYFPVKINPTLGVLCPSGRSPGQRYQLDA